MKNKIDSKDVGLSIGLIFGKYFFKTDDLHYGFWPGDLEVNKENLPKAQELHSEFIISHIPEGTKTILDVGCGGGILSKRFIERGYSPDCVSPSKVLTKRTKENVDGKAIVYEGFYEDVKIEKQYDLVLFSESYQYINLNQSFEQTLKYLKPGGFMLLCDFFKKDMPEEGPLGGGHELKHFYETVKKYPFEIVKDIDITKNTSPNLDIVDDMLQKVGLPIWNLIQDFIASRNPWLNKFLHWKYKKKIDKMNNKYFSGERNGKNFEKYKSYRLILLRRK